MDSKRKSEANIQRSIFVPIKDYELCEIDISELEKSVIEYYRKLGKLKDFLESFKSD